MGKFSFDHYAAKRHLSQNSFLRAIEHCISETDEPERQNVTALRHEIYSLKLKLDQDLKASLDSIIKLVKRYAILLARFEDSSFAPGLEERVLLENFLAEINRFMIQPIVRRTTRR